MTGTDPPRRAREPPAPNQFLAELLATSVRVSFVLLGLVVAFEVLGATALLSGVLGGAGVVGIALGFPVSDTVTNYVASIMLSLRQPFRANDHVVIESNEGRERCSGSVRLVI